MMKWYENVDMLEQILENNKKELEEVEYDSRVWNLLTDESNLIKNHLELIAKNQELKEDFLKPIGFMCSTRERGALQRQNLIYLANKYNLPITIIDSETNNKCKKLEKALEIIKNKSVDIGALSKSDNYNEYNHFMHEYNHFMHEYNHFMQVFKSCVDNYKYFITQEEYNLLREVFGE